MQVLSSHLAVFLESGSGSEITAPELHGTVTERQEITAMHLVILLILVFEQVVEVVLRSRSFESHLVLLLFAVDVLKETVIVLVGLSIGSQREVVAEQVHDF